MRRVCPSEARVRKRRGICRLKATRLRRRILRSRILIQLLGKGREAKLFRFRKKKKDTKRIYETDKIISSNILITERGNETETADRGG